MYDWKNLNCVGVGLVNTYYPRLCNLLADDLGMISHQLVQHWVQSISSVHIFVCCYWILVLYINIKVQYIICTIRSAEWKEWVHQKDCCTPHTYIYTCIYHMHLWLIQCICQQLDSVLIYEMGDYDLIINSLLYAILCHHICTNECRKVALYNSVQQN